MALQIFFIFLWQLRYCIAGTIFLAAGLFAAGVDGWLGWSLYAWIAFAVGQVITGVIFVEKEDNCETVSNT